MDDKSKKGKEKDGSTSAPPHRHKGGLKFKPKVPTKKASKSVPKMEPGKESEPEAIDKDLLMKLRTQQNTRAVERRSNAENNDITTSAAKLPKQCVEPQDFTHPNCNYPPISLPLRHSGDPEILDEDNFSEFSSTTAQDGELTAAQELGLMAESVAEAYMHTHEDVETEGTKSKENDKKSKHESVHGCKLTDLPGGLMGKVLVYKSGKVKMRLGDALFDVSAGLDCAFAQEAVAINTDKKHCCSLGEVSKRVVVTPDVDYLVVDSIKRIG